MNEEYINTLKTLDAIEEYRKKVNEACDKRSERVKLLTKGFELSQMPFGYIKECFENFAPVLFNTKEGRKLIKKYTNEVKNNHTLSTLHTIYENIRKTSKDSDVDFLINSIVNENVNLSQKTVKTVTESLGKILAEAYLYIGKEANELIPEEKQNLDNAIKYITENKKHIKNLSSFSSAVQVIREEIEKHDGVNEFKTKDIDAIANELMREFNEKYNDKLSNDEKKMIKELAENNDKESVFNKYKELCVNKISEAKETYKKEGDVQSLDRLQSIFEQVNKKVFTEDTVEKDICNFIEIASIF
jgi:hypothetical protein